MSKNALQKIVLSGVFAAIIATVTYFVIPVPITHGYVNLGDCFVILCALVLGPTYGFLAAGIGSCLADLLTGFFVYAPATFIIKGLMVLAVYFIAGKMKERFSIIRTVLGALVAETVMVLGYLLFELAIYGGGAFTSIPGNCIQAIFGGCAGIILSSVLFKTSLFSKILK